MPAGYIKDGECVLRSSIQIAVVYDRKPKEPYSSEMDVRRPPGWWDLGTTFGRDWYELYFDETDHLIGYTGSVMWHGRFNM